METLNLPAFQFRFQNKNGRVFIFDSIRKKYIFLTPEEWVRQHFVNFLITEKKYPRGLISLESTFLQHNTNRRSDILVYSSQGLPLLLVECKAPEINLTQNVFDQIAAYNLHYNVPALVVTNGLQHYCCFVKPNKQGWEFVNYIPEYQELLQLRIE